MKMMMKCMLCAGAAAAMTMSAQAGGMLEEEQRWVYLSHPLLENEAETFTFNRFDDQGGTRVLQTVRLEFLMSGFPILEVENNAPFDVPDLGVTATLDATATLGNLSVALSELHSFSGSVAASDGDAFEGDDVFEFAVSIAAFDFEQTTDVSQFVGGGTIDGEIAGSLTLDVTGTPDWTLAPFASANAHGEVVLSYFYTVIPAPGGLALLGVAGLAGGRRRRRL